MSDKSKKYSGEDSAKIKEQPADAPDIMDVVPDEELSETEEMMEDGQSEIESLKDMLNNTQNELEKEKKEYLFLMAEFDNFRKRTLKEKSDLMRTASEGVLKGILPIVDDFERGLDAIKDSSDAEAVKQGMELIYNKFVKFLEQNGVKVIPTEDAQFDADVHEAIAMVPVDDESKKGKVIDTVQKGYMLNDKVIRHAKVAVGQ